MVTRIKGGGWGWGVEKDIPKLGLELHVCQIICSLPQWSDSLVLPIESRSGNMSSVYPVSVCILFVLNLGMRPFCIIFVISWPDRHKRRDNCVDLAVQKCHSPPPFFPSLQCFPGGRHRGPATSGGRRAAASRRRLAAQVHQVCQLGHQGPRRDRKAGSGGKRAALHYTHTQHTNVQEHPHGSDLSVRVMSERNCDTSRQQLQASSARFESQGRGGRSRWSRWSRWGCHT